MMKLDLPFQRDDVLHVRKIAARQRYCTCMHTGFSLLQKAKQVIPDVQFPLRTSSGDPRQYLLCNPSRSSVSDTESLSSWAAPENPQSSLNHLSLLSV